MLCYDQHIQVGRNSVEPPAHEMGRIPHQTMLGKAPLFLFFCLLARTARRSLAPPLTRPSSFRRIISNNSIQPVSMNSHPLHDVNIGYGQPTTPSCKQNLWKTPLPDSPQGRLIAASHRTRLVRRVNACSTEHEINRSLEIVSRVSSTLLPPKRERIPPQGTCRARSTCGARLTGNQHERRRSDASTRRSICS